MKVVFKELGIKGENGQGMALSYAERLIGRWERENKKKMPREARMAYAKTVLSQEIVSHYATDAVEQGATGYARGPHYKTEAYKASAKDWARVAVPPAEAKKIRAAFKAKGFDNPTNDDIRAWYLRNIQEGNR